MSKDAKIICRISSQLKEQIIDFAAEKNEAEAVVIREALREYFERRQTVHTMQEKAAGSTGKVANMPAGGTRLTKYPPIKRK